MPQKYKVYINNKEVIFEKSKTIISKATGQLVYNYDLSISIKEIISKFINDQNSTTLKILSLEPNTTFNLFTKDFLIVQAAGGIVRDKNGNILLIFRNNKWDLPKGKVEIGEKPQQSAVREVMEETGLLNIKITKKLQSTYHTYTEKNKRILKMTHWFEMASITNDNIKPQTEEGITEVRWFKPGEIDEALNNTYLSIKNLLTSYLK